MMVVVVKTITQKMATKAEQPHSVPMVAVLPIIEAHRVALLDSITLVHS
jgi:hypothetical protein